MAWIFFIVSLWIDNLYSNVFLINFTFLFLVQMSWKLEWSWSCMIVYSIFNKNVDQFASYKRFRDKCLGYGMDFLHGFSLNWQFIFQSIFFDKFYLPLFTTKCQWELEWSWRNWIWNWCEPHPAQHLLRCFCSQMVRNLKWQMSLTW